jgi:hypothetical protein
VIPKGLLPIPCFPKDAHHPPSMNAFEMPSLHNSYDGKAFRALLALKTAVSNDITKLPHRSKMIFSSSFQRIVDSTDKNDGESWDVCRPISI